MFNQKNYKMKTAVLILTFLSFIFVNGYSQNRIDEWDIEKITSIQVESRTPDGNTEAIKLLNKSEIDTLLSFLKQIDFKSVAAVNFDRNKILSKWIYRLTFQGQRDQILFCKEYATIGKTLFSIDKKVVKDLKKNTKLYNQN